MGAIVLSQVPNTNTSSAITANNLALVGMNDHIVDRAAVRVASLDGTTSSLPDLDKAIFRACDHPFSFTMKCNTRDIASMAFEGEERVGVGGLDIVELDRMVTSSRKETLVRRDAESIDLRVRVLDCARTDTRERLPETALNKVSILATRQRAAGLGLTELYDRSRLLQECTSQCQQSGIGTPYWPWGWALRKEGRCRKLTGAQNNRHVGDK